MVNDLYFFSLWHMWKSPHTFLHILYASDNGSCAHRGEIRKDGIHYLHT